MVANCSKKGCGKLCINLTYFLKWYYECGIMLKKVGQKRVFFEEIIARKSPANLGYFVYYTTFLLCQYLYFIFMCGCIGCFAGDMQKSAGDN